MDQAISFFYIAVGGAVGACSRYLVSEFAVYLLGRGFPYGTLTVNVIGSFIMGLLIAGMEFEVLPSYPWRALIGLGFLGAFTTFSTFSVDTLLLFQQGEWFKMGLNVVLNVTVCIFVAGVGFHIMRAAN